MQLIQKILDLPVIVQGALGSGLFWLVFQTGQYAVRRISSIHRRYGREDESAVKIALASVLEEDPEIRQMCFQGMVHGAVHNVIKAMILIVFSSLLLEYIPIMSFVGWIGTVFYLFRALAYVPNFGRWGDKEGMKKEYDKLSEKEDEP